MQIKTYIINAFTDQAFKGNPAGVCLLDKPLDVSTMQSIASELNLSETAFLVVNEKDSKHFYIRYFTPTTEIDFCGHATLASSKLILDRLNKSELKFTTHHGLEIAARTKGKDIVMQFPLYDTTEFYADPSLYAAFGISDYLSSRFDENLKALVVEVADKETLLALTPNFEQALSSTKVIKELVVTCQSTDPAYDFYSRCFCPWIGINEDPVTGATHSILAKYWGDKLGKESMSAYQLSKRGGFLNLRILSPTDLEVRSQAQIVFEGIMNV